MRKSNLKRVTAVIALAGLIMAQIVFTGCGKKTVDYNANGNSNQNSGEKDGIGSRLGIPKSCNETIDIGNSTIESITINDNDITVPDTDRMNVVHFLPYSLTKERKKKLAETLFEKDKGIYLFDRENRIKSEIQADIDSYKEDLEKAQADGNASIAASIETDIKAFEKELAEAPDTYPDAGDYEGSGFIGTVGNATYRINIFNYADIFVSWRPENIVDIRPYDGAMGGYMEEEATVTDDEANMSSMTEEEAEVIAADFLADIDITDVVKINSTALNWVYYNNSGEEIAWENDGYVVTYARAIAGTPTYGGRLYQVDNLQLENGLVDISVERFSLKVYDGSVVEANWWQIYGEADSVDENVELLSYEQIIEKANTEMAKYYEKYPTRYKKVEFNDVRLTYYLVSDGEDKCKYIPVWVFSQYEEYADSDGSDAPVQLVILNAMDGSVIDIIEEAKALGCYEDYSTAKTEAVSLIWGILKKS